MSQQPRMLSQGMPTYDHPIFQPLGQNLLVSLLRCHVTRDGRLRRRLYLLEIQKVVFCLRLIKFRCAKGCNTLAIM